MQTHEYAVVAWLVLPDCAERSYVLAAGRRQHTLEEASLLLTIESPKKTPQFCCQGHIC